MNRNYWNLPWKEESFMVLVTGVDCIKDQKYKIACKPLRLELASDFQTVVLLGYSHHNQQALEGFT